MSRFGYFALLNPVETMARRTRGFNQPACRKIDPLRAQLAADRINQLGRPAPSIRLPVAKGELLLKELPGSAGFGNIGISGARRQFWFSFSSTLPRFCSKFHSVIGPLPKRCTGSARSNHTQL